MKFKEIKTNDELKRFIRGEQIDNATLHPLFDKERSDAYHAAMDAASCGDMENYRGYMSALGDIGRYSRNPRSSTEKDILKMMNDLLPQPILASENTVLLLYRDNSSKDNDKLIARHYPAVGVQPKEYTFIWSDDGKKMTYKE